MMKVIMTNNHYVCYVDDADFEELSKHNWTGSEKRNEDIVYAIRFIRRDFKRVQYKTTEKLVQYKTATGKLVQYKTTEKLKDRYKNCRYRTISMHRQILGVGPTIQIDHKNNNGLDNRKCNLRIANQHQNQANQRATIMYASKPCHSKFKGVSKLYGAYVAYIYSDSTRMHLGCFDNDVAAAMAYDVAAESTFGEFARLNYHMYPEDFNCT